MVRTVKTEGFMIRIDPQKHNELKDLADSLGLKLVDLGRLAVDGLLEYAHAHDGQIVLPLRFNRRDSEEKAVNY